MNHTPTPPKQRLILFFDGTWNEHTDRTNVYRLCRSMSDYDTNGVRQLFYYSEGVGTGRYDRFRGGAFGKGLKANLLDGYDWASLKPASASVESTHDVLVILI